MLKVIDLDNQGKDNDGYVFVLTIGGERLGVTDQEILEMVKQKYSTSRATKKSPPKKGSLSEATQLEASSSSGENESRIDAPNDLGVGEASAH